MVIDVLPGSILLNTSLMSSTCYLSLKNVLSCFLTQKSNPFNLMVGVNTINYIITFRKMA
jgi:hypothetical protein